jgi:hypothetical protein
MNRRDTGTAGQYQDFRRLLAEAGFDESLVLATSCRTPAGDDFASMVAAIERAVSEHGLARLQGVGERARLLDLEQACARYSEFLGPEDRWKQFIERGKGAVAERLSGLVHYLEDEAALAVARIRDRPPGGGGRLEPPSSPALLGDYLGDIESGVMIAADGLPLAPVREQTRLAMRKLVYALPLAVGAGIAYVVVTRYLQGLAGDGPFLGLDFLLHSLMVLGLSALVPYLAARLLRPSVRRSVMKRVKAGLVRLQASAVTEWATGMEEAFERSRERSNALETIRGDIEASRRRES